MSLSMLATNVATNLTSNLIVPMAKCGADENNECVTEHWFFPARAEWLYGGLASIIIFTALYKFALPQFKKSLAERSARIQKELDDAANAKAAATAEAQQIRSAKGDIAAERARIMAQAEQQAAQVLADGRARVATELADLEAKANADIATARGRTGDELRAEIARLSNAAVDHVVTGSLDDATHQELIESFIARVGAAR
jgi:F-type H+-transporting ATPase subunit b